MHQHPQGITIGRLAKQTGCNIETVRYYEKIGLIDAPPRSAGGYRQYDAGHVRRVGFIRRCRELGFPLPRIQALLTLSIDAASHTRAEVKQLVVEQQHEIARKIDDLRKLSDALAEIAGYCDGAHASASDCPILNTLGGTHLAAAAVVSDDAA